MTALTETEVANRTDGPARPRRRLWPPLRKGNRAASFFGLIFLVGLVGTFAASWLVGTDPNAQVLEDRLLPPVFNGGSWAYPSAPTSSAATCGPGSCTAARCRTPSD